MSNYLIINADDFGYSRGINYGIIDSFNLGVLSSTTLMANMPGFDHAVSLAKENTELGIGVHLTMTCGSSLLSNVKSLLDNKNNFKPLSFYEKEFTINKNELYEEWKAQIEKIIKAGINPTHLDSHHHVNTINEISDVFLTLAREYDLPVRNNMKLPVDISTTDSFFLGLDAISTDKKIWKPMSMNKLINECIQYRTVEAMSHPGYVDYHLAANSGFTVRRTNTVKQLMDDDFKSQLEKNNIRLITYKDLSNPE